MESKRLNTGTSGRSLAEIPKEHRFDRLILLLKRSANLRPLDEVKQTFHKKILLPQDKQVDLLKGLGILHVESDTIELQTLSGEYLSVQEAWTLYHSLQNQEEYPTVIDVEPLFRDILVPNEYAHAQELLGNPFPAEYNPVLLYSGIRELRVPVVPPDDWAIETMHVREAWNNENQGSSIRIGHTDTGYTNHMELGSAINKTLSIDFFKIGGDGHAETTIHTFPGEYTHGTSTSSVIISPPGKQHHEFVHGVSGVAPAAEVVSIRTNDSVVYLSWGSMIDGIQHAISVGCRVISMSLGGPFPSPSLHRAIKRATDSGIVVIAAAGNFLPFGVVVWPARYQEVIAVAASNLNNEPWPYTSYGKRIDVTAPGEDVWRATWEDKQQDVSLSSGTSYATAHVAGVCALWMAKHGWNQLFQMYGPQLFKAFRKIISDPANCTPLKNANAAYFGGGIIDASKVLSAPLPVLGARTWAITRIPSYRITTGTDIAIETLKSLYLTDKKTTEKALWGTFGAKSQLEFEETTNVDAFELAFHLITNPELRAKFQGIILGSQLESDRKLFILDGNVKKALLATGQVSPQLLAHVQS